ncbi:hypothetical protein BFP70_06890 [Thioclava sp. SK-1]|nr:hypothetical protein BFP70_06890 [Thioclava sp. SK-1]
MPHPRELPMSVRLRSPVAAAHIRALILENATPLWPSKVSQRPCCSCDNRVAQAAATGFCQNCGNAANGTAARANHAQRTTKAPKTMIKFSAL